ncbi:inter-alpha-trypsin inhibitor heavy chain H2-like isoform X2 [Bombina bombina]|nr:inter-alpha-trypsin inhibitor heavy chain H2-like isoform X2 [Bombina bombina]
MPPFQILPTYVNTPTTAHPMYSTESCSDFHVLITAPVLQEKICFEIDEKPDAIVNLIHDVKTGNTLNGQLVEDTSNSNVKFGKFGFINMREELQVEISTEKIIMTHNGTVKTYEWNTSFEEHGFLKKDEEKITVTVHDGVQVTIYKNKNSNYLNLFVEAKHLISSNTSGLLGQVLSVDNLHIGKGFLIIYGKRLPLPSHSYCDLGTELEHHGSCILINIKLDEFINESSKRVTNILEVPQLTPSE